MNKTTLNSQKDKHSMLSLRRATTSHAVVMGILEHISIHALLAESDPAPRSTPTSRPRFLSTLSLRRATAREGRRGPKARDFYPRSPCGERPRQVDTVRLARLDFYPRSPCGERLDQFAVRRGAGGISIHALLAESDDTYSSWFFIMPIFLSTLSLS